MGILILRRHCNENLRNAANFSLNSGPALSLKDRLQSEKIREMNAHFVISLCVNAATMVLLGNAANSHFSAIFLLRSAENSLYRLHRHGGCESLHTNSRSVEEKILKFRADSEREHTPIRDGVGCKPRRTRVS